MEHNKQSADRVGGLDSIRFICAIVVFFRHGAAPPLVPAADHSTMLGIMRGIYGNVWNGPAAVIVFFIISGFCIHYPFAGSQRQPRLMEFYSRRFLRLLVPVAVAIPLSSLVGVSLALFDESVLWSLLAELIYYVLYPAFRSLRIRLGGWLPLIVMAYVGALAVVLTNPTATGYASYGSGFNWILGLPCWLLGCSLAESIRAGRGVSAGTGAIWAWRFGILAVAWGCSVMKFHTRIGHPWTLNVFALLATAWLCREIGFLKKHPPARWAENAGLWSYSLYLLHPAGMHAFGRISPAIGNAWARWLLLCGFVFAVSYAFYRLVERPSHTLARRVARAFGPVAPQE